MTACEWSHSCVQEAAASGPFCYLHTKLAVGTLEPTYFTSRTSSKHFGNPSGEARRLIQTHFARDEDEGEDDDT